MSRIAIIADDLTGALDAASPFACAGARVNCLTNPGAISAEAWADTDVVSVSTNSRQLAAADAASAVREAALKLVPFRPDFVLKKIDSRLKGNIAVESSVVADVFGYQGLLVAPAAPDIGRHVEHGNIVGHGVSEPIDIAEKFTSQSRVYNIPDIGSMKDMHTAAQCFIKRNDTLPVCSRGFAVALAQALFSGGHCLSNPLADPVLIAIGSRDPVTALQVEELSASGEFVVVAAPGGHIPRQWPDTNRLVMFCTGDISNDTQAVANRFAHGLKEVIMNLRPKALLVSGGDTAEAVLRCHGQSQLRILGEVAPGLPVSSVQLGANSIIFISKSGGFGKPTTLLDLFATQQ